jgi:hypothetical protein
MEAIGLPIDVAYLDTLLENWERIQLHYIAREDEFGLYDGTSFRETPARSDHGTRLGLAAHRARPAGTEVEDARKAGQALSGAQTTGPVA